MNLSRKAIGLAAALVISGCAGLDRSGDDPWSWEAEQGTTFADLREQCLVWQEQVVADHIADGLHDEGGHSFLFDSVASLSADLGAPPAPCRKLRREWPGPRDHLDTITWLDLIAETEGNPQRDPEALYTIREAGPERVARMAELLLFDTTVTMVLVERPTGDSASRAIALALLFTFGVDVGESVRLDDTLVMLVMAESVPEISRELRASPPSMAGWAALSAMLGYLASDMYRLAACAEDTPYEQPLNQLVSAALRSEDGGGRLGRARDYYERNRRHFDARCL